MEKLDKILSIHSPGKLSNLDARLFLFLIKDSPLLKYLSIDISYPAYLKRHKDTLIILSY